MDRRTQSERFMRGPPRGLLILQPNTEPRNQSIRVRVEAELYSCKEQQPLWKVSAQLTAKRKDPLFEATAAAYYAERFGEPVRDYVAASFRLLQQVADRCPNPASPKRISTKKST